MADFQSSLTAAELEFRWIGTVVSNGAQNLSEAEKAQARDNIGAIAFGSTLNILGHFDTAEELHTRVTSPKVGDAYSVGAVTPYNLYVYDGLRSDWLDYGQIRATDISSRYVENQSISTAAWVRDDSVFADFTFKARIPFTGSTSEDFPIVAFEPGDASSGNYAPFCFAWDEYVEVFAKAVPNGTINIPVATVIVNGGNGKGITNANGGISAKGVEPEKLADGAIPVKTQITLTDAWESGEVEGEFTQIVTIGGYTITNNSKVDIQPNTETLLKLIEDGVSALNIINYDSVLTAVAVGSAPTTAITLQATVEEVR